MKLRQVCVVVACSLLVVPLAVITSAAAAPPAPTKGPATTQATAKGKVLSPAEVAALRSGATGAPGAAQQAAPAPTASAPHLDPSLYRLAGVPGAPSNVSPARAEKNGRSIVTVAGPDALAAVRAVGGKVVAAANGLVSASVAPSALRSLAATSGVTAVAPSRKAHPLTTCTLAQGTGTRCSEGVGRSAAASWQTAGLNGQNAAGPNAGLGVKVGIVDASFGEVDNQVALGNLPAGTALDPVGLSGRNHCSDGGTSDQHGTAVAEIVHQMAPRAQIILYCVDNNIGFAQAEQQAVADGVSIVNSSLGFDADGRGDGTGINLPGTYVSTALTVKSARQAGILWIQSAGNSAQDHWSGKLVDADTSGPGKNYIDLLNKTRDYDQIQVPPGQGVSISLSWDQWPSSTVPVNLEVIEINVSTGRCTHTAANGSCTSVYAGQAIPGVPHAPVRYINVFNESTTDYYNYQISIKRSGAVPAIRYDLSYAGAASPSLLAAPTFWSAPASHGNPARAAAGSVSEPASSPYALAAGAFDLNSADTTTTRPYYNKLEPFSSRGPTIDGRVKPDLIGYDGVSSNLSEFSTTRFYGTSAGAPHIAGAAALVLGANPALDPAQIQAELEQRATNNTSPPTNANGHGLINLGSPTDTPAPSTGSKYVPLDHPVRVMDTRDATFGHHAKLRAAEQIAVNPALAGVPDDATAVVVNLTGEGATGSLYLAAYPSTFSGTSNLNLSAKTSTAAISAVVPLDPTSHQFKVLNSSATVDVIVDVAGYFTESAAATGKVGYAPLATPQRILDTRPTSQTGSHSGQLSPNESITVSVPASSGVPSGATGIIANITATGGSGAGALATNPPPPGIRLTSNLNYTRADRANLAVIAVQPDGSFTLLNLGSKVQVVIDVLGYFAPSASGTFVPLRSPVRIADSRSGNGGYLGFVQPAKDLSIDAAKLYDVPYNALGVWTNVLAISAKGGLLTAYPTGPSVPNISTLNFTPNEPTPNGSVLAASTVSGEEGMVSVHASTTTYVVLDLFGYFQP